MATASAVGASEKIAPTTSFPPALVPTTHVSPLLTMGGFDSGGGGVVMELLPYDIIGDSMNGSLDGTNATVIPLGDTANATEAVTQMEYTQSDLEAFTGWYQGIHGYTSMVVCILGLAFNIMNVVVLTRKNMITSTNTILTALAIADMMTMLTYLPYASYFYCYARPEGTYGHKKGWIIYLLITTNIFITVHTIAMWLTVSLAVFRYIVVCHHTLGPRLCNIRRAKFTIACVFLGTVIFCIPNYVMYFPKEIELDGKRGYWFTVNPFVTEFVKVINFWLYGVVLKVAPCVLLTVLSWLLLRAMREADRTRRRLKNAGKRAESERTSEHNRTTAMLVAIVLCFVVTELPPGILAFLSGVDSHFFYEVYVPLGDIFDITVLVNSSVNFLLYCIMSRQFRKTFKDVFWIKYQRSPVAGKVSNGVHYNTINSQTTPCTHSTKL